MIINTADRLQKVEEYYFSKKLQQIQKLKNSGIDVINLGIGNPDMPPHNDVINELQKVVIQKNTHGYQNYKGIDEFRETISKWYQKYYCVDLNSSNEILPLLGSKEGIMNISMAFLNKGDKVLIPNPSYPTYSSVSNLVQADVIKYDLLQQNDWQPDFEALQKLDLENVKLMWVNYPNMPTGKNATKTLFEKLISFGKKNKILIVNDNPYSFILNDKPLSIMEVEGAKEVALELNSLSKAFNMAGWRVGSLVGGADYIQSVLRVKSNIDSGMFLPVQKGAIKALQLNENWFKTINTQYKTRRYLAWEILDLLQCEYNKNQVGMFLWAKLPNGKTAEQLSDEILEKYAVFITPGFIFGTNGQNYIRISLCSNIEVLTQAKNRISK